MTRLIASPTTLPLRRHSDPPQLWQWVLVGSFLLHLIAWITVQNFLANSVVQKNSTAIAVEFLEPPGKDDGVSSSPTALDPSNSSQPSRPVEEDPTQTTRSTPAIPLGSISQIAPTQPITERSTTPPTSIAPIQPIAPKKTVPSSPVDPARLKTQPKRAAIQTAPAPDASALKEPLPAVSNTRLPDVPMVPNPTDAKDDSNREIASIPIPSSPAPAQFMAQFRVINSTSNPPNSDSKATISAQILDEPTKLFSSDSSNCALTPKAFHGFGQPVTLQLPLNETGVFDPQKLVTVKQSSGNTQYDELATCVTKISRFIPAYKQAGDRKQAVSSDLEIQVTLIQ